MMDSRLVLPLPEGPISASSSPGRQQPVMLCRICTTSIRMRSESEEHRGVAASSQRASACVYSTRKQIWMRPSTAQATPQYSLIMH